MHPGFAGPTLRQLLTPTGLRYARISDFPGLKTRVAMIYLDSYSQGVNDRLIPMLAQRSLILSFTVPAAPMPLRSPLISITSTGTLALLRASLII